MPSEELPTGWVRKTLGDLGRIVTGKTPSTSVPEHFGGEIPFVTPTDMDGRKFIAKTARNLTAQGVEAVKGSRIPAGAIMVSCIGSDMGKVAVATRDCVTNQQINSLVVSGEVSPHFVFHDLSARRHELRSLAASGSAQPILNKGDFSRLGITLPPPPEQRSIARVLDALDDKIHLNRRTNQTLEDIARALFAHHFPHDPEDFLPPGWHPSTLGEISAPSRETVQPGEVSGNTPYIGLEHMPRRHIALDEWGAAEGVMSGKFAFHGGDILFGKLRPYFHKVGVAPVSGVCSTDILVLRPRAPQWFGLALCHLSSDELIAYTEANSDGTKMPRTSWQALARYPIALPDNMPPGFNETISAFTARIRANIIESRTLAALRDALLPRLLSGEIRVPQAEKEVASHA